MEKTNYPLRLSQNIKELLTILRKQISDNGELIKSIPTEETGNDSAVIYIKGQAQFEKFSYLILEPRLNNAIPFYQVDRTPQNEFSNNRIVNEMLYSDLLKDFESWINILKQYTEFDFNEEEQFAKQYENEFYEEYEILDEDAETTAFDNERQLFLYSLLDKLENNLEVQALHDPSIKPIAIQTNELKNSIQLLSKKSVIKKLSKILAKIKLRGIKIFMQVWDVAWKEAVKMIVKGSVENMPDIIKHLPFNGS